MDPRKFVGFVENSNGVFKMGIFEESKLQISQHHHQEKPHNVTTLLYAENQMVRVIVVKQD